MLICLHSPSSGPIISNMRCGLDEFVLSIPIVFCFSPFSPVPSTLPECIIFSSVSKEGKQSSRRDFLGGAAVHCEGNNTEVVLFRSSRELYIQGNDGSH